MINIYKKEDLAPMKSSCELARNVLKYIESYVEVGVTTEELNSLCHDFITKHRAIPATLNYKGYPKSICTSVNDVVCHGIPGKYKLRNGDILNIDVTVNLDGWFGDTSRTYIVGKTSKLAENLVEITKKALEVGIKAVKPYGCFEDIGRAIQHYVESNGFSVVRDFCGHGIGRELHEDPQILHYGDESPYATTTQILPGMFFTIEPMVNAGSHKIKILRDGWTAVTVDGSLSAQFEHTIAVTEDEVLVLTIVD
ncbi:MAG: type I methionyl aminopeptidase [Holosporales bacterium]|nr:type I methionyl aminopeptidase [Holosporales bacterium]